MNFVDPLGLLDAKAAYNYWDNVGVNGATRALNGENVWDSFVGNSQAVTAATMSAFIDFWAARTLQTNAEKAGMYSAIDGCEGEALKYGAMTVAQIALSAFVGTMHTAKNGIHLGKFGLHRVGNTVVKANLGRGYSAGTYAHLNIAGKHFFLVPKKIIQQVKFWRYLK